MWKYFFLREYVIHIGNCIFCCIWKYRILLCVQLTRKNHLDVVVVVCVRTYCSNPNGICVFSHHFKISHLFCFYALISIFAARSLSPSFPLSLSPLSTPFSFFAIGTYTPWNFWVCMSDNIYIPHCSLLLLLFFQRTKQRKGLTNTDRVFNTDARTHFYQRIMWLVWQRGSLSSYEFICGSS